jgi:hypothetical protein
MSAVDTVSAGESHLLSAIEPLRRQLAAHPLYRAVRSREALALFAGSHVWAVWDFMSLLKALQRALTCVEVPWLPSAFVQSRRLVNEIVLGEESDTWQGGSISHFELYLLAMEELGASTEAVRASLAALRAGAGLETALARAPEESQQFVRATFAILHSGAVHQVAAAFTWGREDLIPEMFGSFVRELDAQMPGRVSTFRYYLERHIEMDGDEHGPMALQMMREVCRSEQQWDEAREAAERALRARLALWDGILARIEAAS